MGLDIAKLRKKMKKIDERLNSGGNATFFRPKQGINVVRILPAKDRGDDFYKEVLIHYNLSMIGMEDKMLNCRKTDPEEKECPLCDTYKMLMKSDDDGDVKVGKRIKPTSRFYLNVVLNSVHDKEDPNYNDVMVWNCPQSVFFEILNSITDEDYLDDDGNSLILDPEDGYDFKIKLEGKGRSTSYTVNVRPKSSPVHVKDWESKLNDLSGFGKTLSEKDMLAKIDGDDNEDNDSEDEDNEEEETHSKRHHAKSYHSDPDEEEEYEDDEEEEKPSHHVRHHKESHRHEEPEDEDDDDEDESDELQKEIKNQAKKFAGKGHGRRTRSRKSSDEEDEDEDDYDDDESDPF